MINITIRLMNWCENEEKKYLGPALKGMNE